MAENGKRSNRPLWFLIIGIGVFVVGLCGLCGGGAYWFYGSLIPKAQNFEQESGQELQQLAEESSSTEAELDVERDAIVFVTDFESGIPSEMSGPGLLVAAEGSQTGNFLVNTSVDPALPTVLKLTDLPPHTRVSIDFLLAIIDSWDGVDGDVSPDFFNVTVDGETIFSYTFDNLVESSQTYVPPEGVLLTPRIGRTSDVAPNGFADLGFGTLASTTTGREPGDALYSMDLDPTFDFIPHTSNTLTIEWFTSGEGYQGGENESWAIDNLRVTLHGVRVAPTEGAN